MPDNDSQKYISKIRVGNEYYFIKDTESVHEIDVDSSSVFKDANGKYWKLNKNNLGAITLEEIIYNTPSMAVSLTIDGVSSNTIEVDSLSPLTRNVTGSITTSYVGTNTPTISPSSISLHDGDLGGNITLINNGSVTITVSALQGESKNPATNEYEYSNSYTRTVSMTKTQQCGWFSASTAPDSGASSGFGYVVHSSNNTPVTRVSNRTSTQTTTIANDNSYLWIINDTQTNNLVANISKATVDSSKLGGGVQYIGTIKMYSTQKTYYLYRSNDAYPANTNVYFKLLQ